MTGFTELLQTVYEKYGLSEQQFGLMTDRKDLPTIVEKNYQHPTRKGHHLRQQK
ncbi:hypothetical protein IPL68_05360 [Candidatus Saccharibacteria bacterium]|nr:MAG: hypothetical protein IPL68_05360 [Candidatus Saccharibacteria bacterium]